MLHLNSSSTEYGSVPVGSPANVASDWMVPRPQSTSVDELGVYTSSLRWVKTGAKVSLSLRSRTLATELLELDLRTPGFEASVGAAGGGEGGD